MLDQLLGAVREIVIAVIGGLLSSLIFVYFQRASQRNAVARLDGLAVREPAREPARAVAAGGQRRPVRHAAKQVLWFLVGMVLVTFVAIVFWAIPETLADAAFKAHGTTRNAGPETSAGLLFLYSMPLFVMSLGAQYADRFVVVWWKLAVFAVVGLLLFLIVCLIVFGSVEPVGGGMIEWPDPKIAEGLFAALILLLEILLTVAAGSHWPNWRIFGARRAEAAAQ